jgi:cytochrome b subunit of formate dehydrogenase
MQSQQDLYVHMARFEMVVARRTDPAAGPPAARRYVIGGIGAVLVSIAAGLLAVVVIVTALVLGYFIAGLVIAAMLVAILVALLRSAFRTLRN